MPQPPEQPPFPKHFDGKRYYNPDSPQARGLRDVLRLKFTNRPEPSTFVADVTPSKPPQSVPANELRVTLINHSTVLLQRDGVHILTDPIWSKRASPVTWAGPRRLREPGVRWEDLPRIDIVLLSHNHYDHLDLASLRRLAQSGQTRFIVPTGVARLLRTQGIGPVRELDWGESVAVAGTNIHGVPALHFSARGPFDRNRTLWCGFIVETAGQIVYFAGDTGFGSHFAQIRERFGSPRLALLPIGAYAPRWFMAPIHMDPEDAVRAHDILGAGTSVATHHGTFQLADEALDLPRKRLASYSRDDSIVVLNNGQSLTLEL